MPTFAGVNHVALTVDGPRRQRALLQRGPRVPRALDIGHGRVLIHSATGFTIALLSPPDAVGGPFTELTTGLDHLGFAAATRAELVGGRTACGEPVSRSRRSATCRSGHHLNFRDPDGIALEFYAPNDVYSAALAELRSRDVSDEEVRRPRSACSATTSRRSDTTDDPPGRA